jgi:hypothetical protein
VKTTLRPTEGRRQQHQHQQRHDGWTSCSFVEDEEARSVGVELGPSRRDADKATDRSRMTWTLRERDEEAESDKEWVEEAWQHRDGATGSLHCCES